MVGLDIDALRSLVAIADTMSFSQAGKTVGRSQSAVSLQISRLEQMLGQACVERTQGRVLGITPAGETLVRYARRILHLNDEAYAALVQPEIGGSVRLGVPADFLDRDLPGLIEAFGRRYGQVRLEVRSDLSRQLQEATGRGLLDLAFVKQAPTARIGQPVLTERLHWVTDGRLDVAGKLASGVLPLVLFFDGCAYRRQTLEVLEAAGLRWQIVFEGTSHSALRAAISSGLGLSVLPHGLISPPLQAIEDTLGLPALPDSEIAVVFAPGRRNVAVDRLADFIAEGIRNSTPRECGCPPLSLCS